MSICSENAAKLAQELFGEKRVSQKKMDAIVDELAIKAKNISRAEGKTFEDSMAIAVDEFQGRIKANALKSKQRVYLNALALKKSQNILDGFKDKAKGLRSILDGTTKFRQSISALIPSKFISIMGGDEGVFTLLNRENLFEKFKDNSKQLDIARALGNEAVEDKEILRIAEIIQNGYEKTRLIQNSLGGDIGKLDNFIASQSHDPFKMLSLDSNPFSNVSKRASARLKGENTRVMAKQRWHDFTLSLLDHEKTFENVPNNTPEKLKFMDSFYEATVTGIRKDVDPSFEAETSFKKGKSFSSRISGERKLIFKDAESWMKYNEKFGTGSLQQSVLNVFLRGSRNIAIMEKLGPDAFANYDRLKRQVRQDQRSDPKIDSKLLKLDHIAQDISGLVNSPVSLKMARITTNLLKSQSLSKLGVVTVRSIPDLAVGAANMRFNGIELTDRWTNQLDNVAKFFGKNTSDLREVHDLLGTSVEAMKGSTTRFSFENSTGGLLSKFEQIMFKWNGLQRWDHVNREGMVVALSRNLANNKGSSWANLRSDLKNALSIYDINENEWNALRKYTNKVDSGKEFITADAINKFTKEDIASISGTDAQSVTPRMMKDVKDSMKDKVMVYFNDNANHAILEPTAGDRAVIIRGNRAGTPLGMALRFVGQFKMYSLAFARRVLPRVASGNDSVSALAELAVSTAMLEYVQMSVASALKGQTPINPSKIESTADKVDFYMKLFTPGLGIWGDFIGGEYNRYGGGVLDSLGGPVLSNGADLVKMFAGLRQGKNPSKAMYHFIKGNTPFINMIWTVPAMKFLILNSIEEQINPGALRRARKRLIKNGQDFYINP